MFNSLDLAFWLGLVMVCIWIVVGMTGSFDVPNVVCSEGVMYVF